MVERYIPGREITCAVIGDFVTDVIEIVPLRGLAFYDYESKYGAGGSQPRAACTTFTGCLPVSPLVNVKGASGVGLPRRVAGRLPLRRHEKRNA